MGLASDLILLGSREPEQRLQAVKLESPTIRCIPRKLVREPSDWSRFFRGSVDFVEDVPPIRSDLEMKPVVLNCRLPATE